MKKDLTLVECQSICGGLASFSDVMIAGLAIGIACGIIWRVVDELYLDRKKILALAAVE